MKFLKIYFYLFLISVFVSQSLMDLFSTLFCLQWVWLWFQAKRRKEYFPFLHRCGLELLFVLWWLICAVGFALTWIDPQYALFRLIEFKWILIFYVLVEVFNQVRPDKKALSFLLSLFFAISAINLFLYFADFEFLRPLRYGVGEFLRAGGLFADPMTFAHSFSLFFCLMLGISLWQFPEWSTKLKTWAIASLVLAGVGLALTFTRGVWIGLLLGVFSLLLLWRPKASAVLLALTLVAGITLYNQSSVFRWRMDVSFQEAGGASERKLLWQAHFLEFTENPFFGLGYGQNGKLLPLAYAKLGIPEGTLVSHAHNQYLHLAAGTGIFGLFCYLFLWFFFFRLLWKLWRKKELLSWDRGVVMGISMAQISFLISGLTEANFEHSKVRFMVMILWAYVIYLAKAYGLLKGEKS